MVDRYNGRVKKVSKALKKNELLYFLNLQR